MRNLLLFVFSVVSISGRCICITPSFEENIKTADVVFVGRLLYSTHPFYDAWLSSHHYAAFKVIKYHKGLTIHDDIVLLKSYGWRSKQFYNKMSGLDFIVCATRSENNLVGLHVLYSSNCSYTDVILNIQIKKDMRFISDNRNWKVTGNNFKAIRKLVTPFVFEALKRGFHLSEK